MTVKKKKAFRTYCGVCEEHVWPKVSTMTSEASGEEKTVWICTYCQSVVRVLKN